jgi:hypothetical protein
VAGAHPQRSENHPRYPHLAQKIFDEIAKLHGVEIHLQLRISSS